MLSTFPTQFCLWVDWLSFCYAEVTQDCTDWGVPVLCPLPMTMDKWVDSGTASAAALQGNSPDSGLPLASVPGLSCWDTLSFGSWQCIQGSEALWWSCPKTTGPAVTFWTRSPWFFLRLPTLQVLSLQFPGSSCVQAILSEIAWERSKCRQNNKYTCIGLPFLADRRCFGT